MKKWEPFGSEIILPQKYSQESYRWSIFLFIVECFEISFTQRITKYFGRPGIADFLSGSTKVKTVYPEI